MKSRMKKNLNRSLLALAGLVLLAGSAHFAYADHGGQSVRQQVRQASNQWIANFNAGDVDAIADAYVVDATLWAEPIGIFEGRDAIRAFWHGLIGDGATNLRYRKRRIRVLSDTLAIVRADWSMNIGGGIIYQEKWVKQSDGVWKLQSDHFDVLVVN